MTSTTGKSLDKKSFWKRPEGVTGTIFLVGLALGGVAVLATALPLLIQLASQTLYLALMLVTLGALVYLVADSRTRNLIGYMYKSLMRWITGFFVELDPIGILKNYIAELNRNLSKMNRQISRLRGQRHTLKEIIVKNQKEIKTNLELASKAKANNQREDMIVKSRRAGRLQESNQRLEALYGKMEVLYRVLKKMYESSRILKEDVEYQVEIKERERKAIHASHNAMKSAMSVISGDPDRRAMFDMAMEAITDDVSKKVGEMERFMEMSSSFMESLDLQNGVFEEEGLKLLEKWENEGTSLLLGEAKEELLLPSTDEEDDVLDLDQPIKETLQKPGHKNQYDSFFDN